MTILKLIVTWTNFYDTLIFDELLSGDQEISLTNVLVFSEAGKDLKDESRPQKYLSPHQ